MKEEKSMENKTDINVAKAKASSKRMAMWSIIIALIGIFIFNVGIINAILVLIALFLNITASIAYVPNSHKIYNLIAFVLTIIAFW